MSDHFGVYALCGLLMFLKEIFISAKNHTFMV